MVIALVGALQLREREAGRAEVPPGDHGREDRDDDRGDALGGVDPSRLERAWLVR
jgi:hypothetical protein